MLRLKPSAADIFFAYGPSANITRFACNEPRLVRRRTLLFGTSTID